MLKNDVFGSLNLNNSEIFRLSFDYICLGDTRHIYDKNEPTLAVLGGGEVHGKVCWLIAYNNEAHIVKNSPYYCETNFSKLLQKKMD